MCSIPGNVGFFRKKLEDIIDFIRQFKTLRKMMLFVFDFRIRRPMIKYVSQNLDDDLIAVEIGSFEGENAKNMLLHLPIKHLYLIDPYLHYSGYRHSSGENIPKAFDIAQKRLSKFKDKITFIKKLSEQAVDDVADKLDFVYIDGNHNYKYVKKDIQLYYPKLKKGSIIGGHDIWGAGVQKAVIEFSKQNDLEVHVKYPDWWVVKK